MQAALLIGNGLNKCYDDSIDWGKLLKTIAHEYQVRFNDKNPFPLEFESIVSQILIKDDQAAGDVYDEVKSRIADMVCSQTPTQNSLHRLFTSDIPADHILTTNYDYMLERAFLGKEKLEACEQNKQDKQDKQDKEEIKYSLHRFKTYLNKTFYHIHGEANKAKTLCLGYEHYAGYLSKMREYLKAKPVVADRVSGIELPEKRSWVNLFFTHDIYIVGLKLDTNEIDLWWLLTYRAYLYYSNDSELRSIMKNRIKIFLTDSKPDQIEILKNRQELFRNLHVEAEIIKVGEEGYEGAFRQIAGKITQEIRKRKLKT